MRRLLTAALLIGGAAVLLTAAPAVSSGSKSARPEGRCKFVVKRVHGHRKRVKVCKHKPKPKPKPKPQAKPKADIVVAATSSLKRVTAGNQLVYEVELKNLGPEAAFGVELSVKVPGDAEVQPGFIYSSGSVAVSDPGCEGSADEEGGPFEFKCTLGDFPATDPASEQEATFELRLTIEPEHAGSFAVEASAQAADDTEDPHPENNSVTTTVDVAGGPASADLSVSVEGAPDPATVLDDFAETVRVTNHGPTEATTIQVPILLPLGAQLVDVQGSSLTPGCQYYSPGPYTATACWDVIQPGETVEAKVILAPLPNSPPNLEINLFATAYTADPDLANNRTTAKTAVAPFTPVAGVDLGASLYTPRVEFGRYVAIPFGIRNRGTQDAKGAHLVLIASGPVSEFGLGFNGPFTSEPFIGPCEPPESGRQDCLVGSLPGGSRISGYFFAELSGTGELKVTLTAVAEGQDANPADNSASVSLQVGASPERR